MVVNVSLRKQAHRIARTREFVASIARSSVSAIVSYRRSFLPENSAIDRSRARPEMIAVRGMVQSEKRTKGIPAAIAPQGICMVFVG